MQLILEEVKAIQERIQKDIARLPALKVKTEETLLKIQEEH